MKTIEIHPLSAALGAMFVGLILLAPSCATTRTGDTVARSGNMSESLLPAEAQAWANRFILDISNSGVLDRFRGTPDSPGIFAFDEPKISTPNWRMGGAAMAEIKQVFSYIEKGLIERSGGSLATRFKTHDATDEPGDFFIHGAYFKQRTDHGNGRVSVEFTLDIRVVDWKTGITVFNEVFTLPGGKEYWNGIFGT